MNEITGDFTVAIEKLKELNAELARDFPVKDFPRVEAIPFVPVPHTIYHEVD